MLKNIYLRLFHYEQEIKSLLAEATEVHDKVVVVKAIANAALPVFLPELEKIIVKPAESIIVKEVAIYALANYTIIAPEKVILEDDTHNNLVVIFSMMKVYMVHIFLKHNVCLSNVFQVMYLSK